jgi:RND family efflux transporter MFP subunit
MSDLQIRALEQSRTIPDAVEMRSPQSGVVVARSTSVGQRFERGDELYRIADLQHVWILADLFPDDARLIPAGATALVHGGEANQTLHARVSNSVPEVDPVAQTVKLRLDAENPGLVLKPNMFVDIEVSVPMPRGLTVPTEAVLDSGNGKTVFVKTAQDTFEARAVETGWRSNGRVQVTKGLKAGENVAVSGQFLIDSETRLAHP